MSVFRYAEVQVALAKLHGAYPDHMGAFRGRLQHFQRLGMAPASPGRGKSIAYAFEDVARWAFALELVECGIDPARISRLMPWAWIKVGQTLCEPHEGERIFFARPMMMIAQMAESENGPIPASIDFGNINAAEKGPALFVFDAEELSNWRPDRALQVNLTTLRKSLLKALGDVSVDRIYEEGSFE